jgi:hypothetical protein
LFKFGFALQRCAISNVNVIPDKVMQTLGILGHRLVEVFFRAFSVTRHPMQDFLELLIELSISSVLKC